MMTEPKVLIQRGELLYCDKCDCAWPVGEEERHDSDCMWYVDPQQLEQVKEIMGHFQKLGEECEAFGPDIEMGKPPIPVVPIYGWVCSRCQRVFAPHIAECSHCQPGVCVPGGLR
jgi:hypothetical protein